MEILMADNTRRPHEDIVAELHKRLETTLKRLSAHIEAHGMLDDREDETLAMGALALQEARDGGLIVDGGFNAMLGIVPLDDETASVADSNLVDTMIGAGIDVLERVDHDNANYVSGVTTDWDQGMVAVAVYRAMTRSSRERAYACALEIDDRGSYTEVQATSPMDAARVFALRTFHANEGEWMGGNVMVLQMPLGDGQPDLTFTVFGGRYDTTIEFPADRDPYATAVEMPR
jgi:hypothetical protein